jgi:hypothetical protein
MIYGFAQMKPKKRNMFSRCINCLQQTLAATNSAAHVESASLVCRMDPHITGVQLTKIVYPEMLSFNSPTANEASVYATVVVKREVVGRTTPGSSSLVCPKWCSTITLSQKRERHLIKAVNVSLLCFVCDFLGAG